LAYTTNEDRTFLLLFYAYGDDDDDDDGDDDGDDVHNKVDKDMINVQSDDNQMMDDNTHMDSDVEEWVVNKRVRYDAFH
jgi:hypothetical protein